MRTFAAVALLFATVPALAQEAAPILPAEAEGPVFYTQTEGGPLVPMTEDEQRDFLRRLRADAALTAAAEACDGARQARRITAGRLTPLVSEAVCRAREGALVASRAQAAAATSAPAGGLVGLDRSAASAVPPGWDALSLAETAQRARGYSVLLDGVAGLVEANRSRSEPVEARKP